MQVGEANAYEVFFNADKPGKYVLCYDGYYGYNITFYRLEGHEHYYCWVYKFDEEFIYKGSVPKREGYVFTGWKAETPKGLFFSAPQPLLPEDGLNYYATWCPEDEYEPIRLSLLSDGDIEPGKEDGEVLTIKTNYGIFENEEELNSLASECWKVVGAEGVTVSEVKRTGDKEVEITLSGNSADASPELYVEFDSSKLLPEPYEKDGNIVTDDDTKIKMDEYGFRARMYRSDNALVYGELSTGDVDGNGSVNTRDAVALRRAVAGGYDGNPTIGKMLDVNGDGRVNTRDVAALRTIIVQG